MDNDIEVTVVDDSVTIHSMWDDWTTKSRSEVCDAIVSIDEFVNLALASVSIPWGINTIELTRASDCVVRIAVSSVVYVDEDIQKNRVTHLGAYSECMLRDISDDLKAFCNNEDLVDNTRRKKKALLKTLVTKRDALITQIDVLQMQAANFADEIAKLSMEIDNG